MRDITILKIGGSVATFKDQTEAAPRTDLLNDIFKHIATLRDESETELLLIHGAGTYGHTLAKKYGLQNGSSNDYKKIFGAMRTRHAVQELNTAVLSAALDAGLPLCAIHPGAIATQDHGEELTLETTAIENTIARRTIPLLYGDMVPDHSWGFSVSSGDSIAASLSSQLPVKRILFATDVDGVYTKDPHRNQDAELIETIRLSDFADESVELGDSHNVDVTSGLAGKMRACKKMFEGATALSEIHIFNGLRAENIKLAIAGKPFKHTLVTK